MITVTFEDETNVREKVLYKGIGRLPISQGGGYVLYNPVNPINNLYLLTFFYEFTINDKNYKIIELDHNGTIYNITSQEDLITAGYNIDISEELDKI